MMDHISYFQSLLGQAHVIADDQKLTWAKDYTKAFQPNPLVVLFPSSTEEVQAIARYCYKNKLAMVPSGGRTGLSGGAAAANGEVVISMGRMRKIFGINSTDRVLHCQAGTVTKEIQRASLDGGLYFPVDFASSGSSHIGGNIATNAGGIKVIRYGLTRQWVAGLKVVLADGTLLDLSNICLKNNTGYELKHLFIGSEGTLGIITEAWLRLTSPPPPLLLSLYGLDKLEDVTQLFELAQNHKLPLTAYEFFTDSALIRVQQHAKLTPPFSQSYPFYTLVEMENAQPGDEKKLEQFVEVAFEKNLVRDGVMSQSAQQFQDFWIYRENIAESLSVLTVPHKNDISLPLNKITAFCTELQKLISENYPGFEVVSFGHIGDGNLHVNFIKPPQMDKKEFFEYAHHADHAMFSLVKQFGGSISAEHGVGLTKKSFLKYTRSEDELRIMGQIKKIFDPFNLMNPGKILDI